MCASGVGCSPRAPARFNILVRRSARAGRPRDHAITRKWLLGSLGLRPSCRSGPARELNPRARGGLRSAAPMTLWFCDHAGSNTSPHTHPGPVWTPHLQRPARRWAAAARSPCPRGGVSSLPAPLAPTKSLLCLLNILFGLVQRARPCADDLDSIVHPKRVSCAAWWAWFVVAVQVR